MENNYENYSNFNEVREFKTNLKTGEIVIVDYKNVRLGYNQQYVSIVKNITINEQNHIYTCKLDNFNIDFELYNSTISCSIISASYTKEDIYAYIYTIEDYKLAINHYFNKHTDNLKNYKRILKEAIKLKKQIEQKQYAI